MSDSPAKIPQIILIFGRTWLQASSLQSWSDGCENSLGGFGFGSGDGKSSVDVYPDGNLYGIGSVEGFWSDPGFEKERRERGRNRF